ncbi:probable ATP-dependent RNA helicase Dbp73D [Musca domestica]|uniref:Probable ATP-dependent RNA helicase Dbp73D n=1 Tax=Musca domestica TaxID=7370 RepID=A0ABM3UPQ7_MUSDO|nr:probable ATP-dependent RNA helicase Dbp73D [Musca domestica]
MELFAVNRYDVELDKKQSNEDEILQKLLKKVEKRKRKHSESEKKKPKQVEVEDDVVESKETISTNDIDNALPEEEDVINAGTYDKEELEVDDTPAAPAFEVLGEDVNAKRRIEVQAVLPAWLAHPHIISTSVAAPSADTAEDSLAECTFLSPQIRGALKEMKISRLFPVQTAVVPWILDAHTKPAPFRPRDVCVSAPTGSGKTLAFAIPVVQILAQRTERKIRALVILPVAELALQVYRVFKKLCEKTDLNVCLLSNHTPLPLEKEKLVESYKGQWYSKVDIVVTTPGRLVEHLHGTEGFCLKNLKFLIIDEADRIMDAVFQNWLYHLDTHVRATSDQLLSGQSAPLCYNELEFAYDRQPHKLLFSATLSQDPEKLQNLRLFQPILFTSVLDNLKELQDKYVEMATSKPASGEFIGKYTTPAELTEKFCLTQNNLKPLTLFALIKELKWQKFLCFTNSVEASERLNFVLQQLFSDEKIRIAELSGSRGRNRCSELLSKFSRGQINGLVCSDALARGIDIPGVDIVISYDPPRHIKTYIHRVGRTARAGRPGTAITLLSQHELDKFHKLLNEVGKVVTAEQETFPDIEEANAKKYQGILQRLREKLVHDKRKKILEMNRAREVKELESQDVTKLTPMEKLQMQATIKIHDSTKTHENEKLSNKKLKSFNRKFKKNAAKADNAVKSQDTKAKGKKANKRKGNKGARVKTNKFKQKKPQNKK